MTDFTDQTDDYNYIDDDYLDDLFTPFTFEQEDAMTPLNADQS